METLGVRGVMIPAEKPLFHAVLDDPDDLARWSVYADWLQEQGDARGDYLRLLLALGPLETGDPQIAVIRSRLRELRPTLDRHWAAIFGEYQGRIREVRTVRLLIRTYGSAPKKYNGATKVGHVERALLVRNGWEYAGDGAGYSYARRPAGTKAKDPIIPVEVPTDPEIERLATLLRQDGRKALRLILGPWIIEYRESQTVEGPNGQVRGPASFEFGLGAPWSVRLSWKAGDDSAPHWMRSETSVVK